MSEFEPFHAYLALAGRLFNHQVNERTLPAAIAELPPIDRPLLEKLAAQSEVIALTRPRHSWAICRVADIACRQQNRDLFIRSLAAWYLARAANHWMQPKKVARAAARARRGFLYLNEGGWVAACDWIANDLGWTRPDLKQSEITLKNALVTLESAGLDEFAPLCRLALVSNQLLNQNQLQAEANLAACKDYFVSHNDSLNLARCWLQQSEIYRRLCHFDSALSKLKQAQLVFKQYASLPDLAYSFYLCGLLYIYSTTNLIRTINQYNRAEKIFAECDLELRQAQCFTDMGMTYLQVSQLEKAESLFKKASPIYLRHQVLGLYADNLILSGMVYLEKGLPENSVTFFKQAYFIHSKMQDQFSCSNDLVNLGNAYNKIGHYQQALQALESAIELIKPLNLPRRLGVAEMYLARTWLQLGDYPRSLEHLDQAQHALKVSNQADSRVTIAWMRAKILFEQGNLQQSRQYLLDALLITRENNIPSQTALTHRMLGELCLHESQIAEAYEYLQQSLQEFTVMNMQLEQAVSLVSLGTLYVRTGDLPNARKYFEKGLQLSKGEFKEVDWRAYAGVAELALLSEDPPAGLESYRQAVKTLSSLRSTLWQPALAGSYAKTPKSVYAGAISLAIELDSPLDALQFIETNKAVTLINQLTSLPNVSGDRTSQELQKLKAEIEWIQKQMQGRVEDGSSIKNSLQLRGLRKSLQEKSQQYDDLVSRFERKENNGSAIFRSEIFSLSRFRELAAKKLGKSWVALDYYQIKGQLVTVVITAEECKVFSNDISQRFTLAVQACLQNGQTGLAPVQSDLEFLGVALIPPPIEALLTPATTLIIAPHNELHQLPWAALGEIPLVLRCIPCIVPSLHGLILLGERSLNKEQVTEKNGLLLGISDFAGSHPALPFVKQEIADLQPLIGKNGRVLLDQEATLAVLTQLGKVDAGTDQKPRPRQYDWLHVASHFFSDPVSGSLSGLALSDGTLWLDQIRDLAPLPPIVTFSGCSSIFSRIYAGDEQVGLPNACFIAGADTVVGSVWPVLDAPSAKLMTGFYQHYLKNAHPALALAQAQREIIASGEKPSAWAGFACLGIP